MLTLIVPVRDWPQERIDFCVQSFRALSSKTLSEIVVVDFGSAVPVATSIEGARVLRVEAPRWSLAEAINAGVAIAENDVVAKTDADILIGHGSVAEFDRIARAVARGRLGLATTQATDLPPEILAAEAAQLVASGATPPGRLRPKWGQGGLVFFSRATWDAVGGFDARFTGWGNEDNDFAERVRRSGRRVMWADRRLEIFHVWHPPSYAATGVISQRLRNQKIARDDKSVFRPLAFRHSDFTKIAAPAVLKRISPLVTLGIATTARPNRDRMITEAINSFRDQVDNDFEILVVDNGSPPGEAAQLRRTLERIRWTAAARIEVLGEASIPASRNAISRLARGRYVCVVDDDDIALPNRLADHLKPFAADGQVHGSHGGWIDFDESTGVIERNSGKQRLISTLLKGNGKITAHPASLYRTDVMRAMPYDESFALGSDFDLALRFANAGFEVPHTHSYLTLRRYHSANVTITGQSNQVSNGQLARSRTLLSFDWQRVAGLEEEAKKNNDEAYCRNQLSIDSLADLIPGYSGSWRIYVPISALESPLVEEEPTKTEAEAAEAIAAEAIAVETAAPDRTPETMLSRLMEIIDGDLCTKASGLNQPIYFRSREITGLKRARKIKSAIEELIGFPAQLNSVRQAEIDREAPFDWAALSVKAGERVLQSARFDSLPELLAVVGALPAGSLLRSSLSVLSDFDASGESYCAVTSAIKGTDNLRQFRFELERRFKSPFRSIAAQGVESELTPISRSH